VVLENVTSENEGTQKFVELMLGLPPESPAFKLWRHAYCHEQFRVIRENYFGRCFERRRSDDENKVIILDMVLEIQTLPVTQHFKYFLAEHIQQCLLKGAKEFDYNYTTKLVLAFFPMVQLDFRILSGFFNFIGRTQHYQCYFWFWNVRDLVCMRLFELGDKTKGMMMFLYDLSKSQPLPEGIIEMLGSMKIEENEVCEAAMKIFLRNPRPTFTILLVKSLMDETYSFSFTERLLGYVFIQLKAALQVRDEDIVFCIDKFRHRIFKSFGENHALVVGKIMSLLPKF